MYGVDGYKKETTMETIAAKRVYDGLATEQDPRWRAVVARDKSADGTFYYSVKMTGVYCRPSCASRLAKPKNVSFHLTREEAERAGFRPCKRCKPDRKDVEPLRAMDEIQFTVSESSYGPVLVGQSRKGVCAVLFGSDRDALLHDLQGRFPGVMLVDGGDKVEALAARVVAYMESPIGSPDVPLDIRGTGFQRRVWQALREIPAGSTASYTDVARRIGLPKAARAVAQACAANNLAVLIPCHRVVRSDGALSGYRWGVERKRALLERESRRS
jgi:AraC family transcriptional regulator, regulatory protein of adaptative response / methylated-DNA-[protein]-cysteine methyltransferase